ncbi:MAG: 23S rRNA (adenine(2503)-C(2))-methyltransferase RlmN [Dysgonamonadaceae bacterium]|jgi:23S rRNA (adenine2503-C2)-methyltransferase|nr:23S rRNA (adenine(2503)-C(2))-methyltransferase RlmN [Dysgonamonadaceae bacterium]
MEVLLGKTFKEIQQIVEELNMPRFAAKQITQWLYQKKASSIDEMSNISLKHRQILKDKYTIGRTDFIGKQESTDKTVKYLFATNNNRFIESVYIPEKERATLCVSSQVGCKMNCLFCMTGKQGFAGQLTSGDILNQIISIPESNSLTNIVYMGMGEPLDNLEELFKSLEIITSDYGFGWSPKRITVSTIGPLPALKRFLEESKVHLAISLHSPFHFERLSLMPIEKAYPLSDVIHLIKQYDFSHQRRVSFEYILFAGLNDDFKHALALSRLIKDIPCRVNLIKYHRIPEINLPASDTNKMVEFRDFLNDRGIACTIRTSRGEDILAACGMLSTNKNKE